MKYPRYPAYKASGIAWLPEIPTGWEAHRLKWTVTGCDNGVWGEDPDGSEDDIVCLRVADFDREAFRISTDKLTVRAVDERQRLSRLIKRGDLLLEKSGGGDKQLVGCVVHFDHDFPAVSSNFVARMPIAAGHSPRYWAYVHASLYAGRLNYPAIKQTTGIQNLDAGEYLSIHVAYPKAGEQQEIAAFLDWKTDQIEALIAKKKMLIEVLLEQRNAIISAGVTQGLADCTSGEMPANAWQSVAPDHWGVTTLKYATCRIVDCPHDTPEYDETGDFSVVRTADLDSGRLTLQNARRVDEIEFRRRIRREPVLAGDLLYSREGERWGHAAMVPEEAVVCLGQRMMQFRAAPDYSSAYLMWHLNAKCVYEQGAIDAAGSTAPHVNVETIRNYRLLKPPLHEQEAIATDIGNRIGAVDQLIQSVQRGIDCFVEYRSALITAAVTGQIDVRNVAVSDPA